jgi:hypothetical protein
MLLWLLQFLFRGAMSEMDVAMNEQAVFVERQAKKPLMSRLSDRGDPWQFMFLIL